MEAPPPPGRRKMRTSTLVAVLLVALAACGPAPLPAKLPPGQASADPRDGGSPGVRHSGGFGDPGATTFSQPRCDPQPGGVGQWKTVGNMVDAERIGGTATVLDDGDILVVGGWMATGVDQCGGPPRWGIADIAERYSIATGQWHRVATPLTIGRWYHTTTKLKDGRVLIAGGLWPEHEGYPYFCPTDIPAEIYDPDADTWTQTSPMHYQRAGAVAVLLADGRVLVIGGTGSGSTEIYDPSRDTWTDAAPTQLDIEQAYPSGALLLRDGTVLAAGSDFRTGALETEIYDPYLDEWRDERPLPIQKAGNLQEFSGIIMQPLPSGRVMVALRLDCLSGCYTSSSSSPPNHVVQETAYIEDPYTGIWSSTPPLPSITFDPASVVLSDGRILVAGGNTGWFATLTASIFDEAFGAWRRAAEMPHSRENLLIVPLPGDAAFVLGGAEYCLRNGVVSGNNDLPVDRFHLDPLGVGSP